jgi:hypothetical protein
MGLNDLQLSPAVLAALYPSSLVDTGQESVQQPKPIQRTPESTGKDPVNDTSLKYLGDNQKNILVVVNYGNAVHLPDEELNFLTNMLTACKLGLGDVVIINKNNLKEETYKDLLARFQSRTIFLFGVEPFAFGLPVSFPHYQVQRVANCTFLYAPPLEEQRNDPLLKSKLWVSLRSVFNI